MFDTGSNGSRCLTYIVDMTWKCLSGVCQVCLTHEKLQSDTYSSVSAPCFCSFVTSYFGVMIGTHRSARLWFSFWLLPGICRAVSPQDAQRKTEACDFLAFFDFRTRSLSEKTLRLQRCEWFAWLRRD